MRLASSALLLLALLLAAPAAHGQGAAGARAELIADALREDPLYVSDDLQRVATDEAVAGLRAAMERWDQPVYVIWAPFFLEEPGITVPEDLLTQIHDQLGRDGLYLRLDPDGIGTDAEAFGRVALADRPVRGSIVTSEDVPYAAGAVARGTYLLDYLRTGERPDRGAGEAYDDRDDTATRRGLIALVVVALVTWALLLVWRTRRVRRKRAPAAKPTATGRRLPEPVTAGAHLAAAREALDRLRTRVDAAPDPPVAAVDALAAGEAVLARRDREAADELGALVLARLGDAALGGREDRRPCFFNPLHPWAAETVPYTFGGQTLPLPTCRDCARRVRHEAEVDVLVDGDGPYWERDTVWARTGYGALDHDLARDLLAGAR